MAAKNIDTVKKTLLREMLRIRMIEERIAEIYPRGEIRTPAHFSIGQEAVSVGVCAALGKDDWVFNSHRCHAGYLARGGSLSSMMAELFGRSTGVCGGKSGSAHLASPKINMYSAPILGALIPVGVGVGFSFAMDGKKNIAVVFFGDAAFEEGVCAESINFAVLKKVPVLFVCENNFFSSHTHIKYRQPAIPIYKRVKSYGIEALRVDGMDVMEVYKASARLVKKIRDGSGPLFMECTTYRFLEHVGPNFDFNNPYRTEKEVRMWMRRCPIARLRRRLLKDNTVTEKELESMAEKISLEIDGSLDYARKSPWPEDEDLLKDVY
ncbi:MAG: thiamine pyrophosphate-dependent dehydrogenase E1 component subunit alpha [Candidatus Omnitrophica bacterium]|nr:thiamine pyrophosphate-dependent dehydrogenase E1 component subunit alpha [Candidatus Omnitrophota bacterium]